MQQHQMLIVIFGCCMPKVHSAVCPWQLEYAFTSGSVIMQGCSHEISDIIDLILHASFLFTDV